MRFLILALAALPLAAAGNETLAEKAVSILLQRCGSCHGDKAAMSDLRLSDRDQAVRGGKRGPAIKPGQANESLLLKAVSGGGPVSMPPGAKLADEEVATLRTWIDKGAEWPDHVVKLKNSDWWAFQKFSRPPVPEVAGAKNPIDAFITAKLQSEHLDAAPEADKYTLLKRACYDLTGLPPTAEQTKTFFNDKSPEAWEH